MYKWKTRILDSINLCIKYITYIYLLVLEGYYLLILLYVLSCGGGVEGFLDIGLYHLFTIAIIFLYYKNDKYTEKYTKLLKIFCIILNLYIYILNPYTISEKFSYKVIYELIFSFYAYLGLIPTGIVYISTKVNKYVSKRKNRLSIE